MIDYLNSHTEKFAADFRKKGRRTFIVTVPTTLSLSAEEQWHVFIAVLDELSGGFRQQVGSSLYSSWLSGTYTTKAKSSFTKLELLAMDLLEEIRGDSLRAQNAREASKTNRIRKSRKKA